MRILTLLPLADWLALGWFFLLWIGYSWYAKHYAQKGVTLLAVTNHYRELWMAQAIGREQRNVDALILQSLSNTPSFFASTTILIVGGVLAMLTSTDKVAEIFSEIPFSQATTNLIFDIKILLLLAIFVFAFFRFTWSVRQYSFAALMIGSMPDSSELRTSRESLSNLGRRAGVVLGLAAESFNAGVRAYYFAFAALCWFISPSVYAGATAAVVIVIYVREFKSDVMHIMRNDQIEE